MIHTGADDLRSWMVDCCSFWKISLQPSLVVNNFNVQLHWREASAEHSTSWWWFSVLVCFIWACGYRI